MRRFRTFDDLPTILPEQLLQAWYERRTLGIDVCVGLLVRAS